MKDNQQPKPHYSTDHPCYIMELILFTIAKGHPFVILESETRTINLMAWSSLEVEGEINPETGMRYEVGKGHDVLILNCPDGTEIELSREATIELINKLERLSGLKTDTIILPSLIKPGRTQ